MERYVYHLMMACVLGLCRAEQDDVPIRGDSTKCICKPVMRLEWEPTSSICNNATFDWLMQTVLAQVTKQNEDLAAQNQELEKLRQEVGGKEQHSTELQDKIASMERQVFDLKDENHKLQQQIEDHTQHRAHLKPQPKDCADVQRYGFHYSGIYTVYPRFYPDGVEVFCDLNTEGGGWLVFQRRQDGSQDFAKLWEDYKWGFGKVAKEFWLGNDKLNALSLQRDYELRVDMTDFTGERYYATYNEFSIAEEKNKYQIHVTGYDGNAGDALKSHNGRPFSTTDNDNDQSRSGNCAELYGGGGWWFDRCYDSNLNGLYSNRHLYETVVWFQLRRNHEPMRHVEMKMRPRGFNKQ